MDASLKFYDFVSIFAAYQMFDGNDLCISLKSYESLYVYVYIIYNYIYTHIKIRARARACVRTETIFIPENKKSYFILFNKRLRSRRPYFS